MQVNPLSVTQAEIGDWALRNFGVQAPYRPFLGVGEELGELREAALVHDHAKARDAIGDIAIYLNHYCVLREWSFEEIWDARMAPGAVDMEYLVLLGRLCHHQLKSEQGIRGGEETHAYASRHIMGYLLWMLDEDSMRHGGQFLEILQGTWDQVKQRDWKKNPANADKVADGTCSDTLRPAEGPVDVPGMESHRNAVGDD